MKPGVSEITLQLPADLYQEARDAGLLSPAQIERLLREALHTMTWEERVQAIQREIEATGGAKQPKEKILAELRRTRRHLWDTEYRWRYPRA